MNYETSGSLTDAMNFTPKAVGAPSRSFRMVLNPINSGNASPGDVVKFDIPVGRPNQFIDTSETCFQFGVLNNTANDAFYLDGSAYCFVNRLDVLSAGQVLETIQSYNVLTGALLDLQVGGPDAALPMSINLGTGYVADANYSKYGKLIAKSGTSEFSLPLACSGVLGSGCSKYLPIAKVNDLRLELTIENAVQAVVQAANTATFSITSPQLVLTYVEVAPDMAQQLEVATGGRYMVSTESWRNYQTILPATRTGDSVLIPARYSSLRTLLHTFRDNANNSDQSKWWLSARTNPFFSSTGAACSIQYALGSVLVPQSPVKGGVAEAWCSTQQAFHNLGSISPGSRCSINNWVTDAYSNTSTMGSFAFAQNFDSFLNKSTDMSVVMNTLAQPTFLNMSYPASVSIANRFDTFAHFDALIEIDDAGLRMRY
jgi:hypothetical protein